MKNKKILVVFFSIILLILSILLLSNNTNNKKKLVDNETTLAVTINGNVSETFPDFSKEDYTVSVDCNNAIGSWKYTLNEINDVREWNLVLKDITGNVSCNLDFFTKTEKDLLSKVIESDENIINNSSTGIRYQGTNPNNYIWFNDELWRIIGLIPTKDMNSNDISLVKIIRMFPIDTLIYDKESSDYSTSDLYYLLNDYYYKRIDATQKDYCYAKSDIKGLCKFSVTGIYEYYRNFIEPVQWPIGRQKEYVNPKAYFEAETSLYTNKANGINVGLINVSDYGYAAAGVNDNTTETVSITNNDKSINNWIWSGYDRLLSLTSDNKTNVMSMSGGILNDADIKVGYGIRPAVYLDPTIYVVSGNGSITYPYILDM